MSSIIHAVGCWVDVPESVQLLAGDLGDLRWGPVLGDGVEIAVDQRIGVSLSTDASESAMEETSVLQHLPDGGVTPIVWDGLWEDFDLEIVVSALKEPWRSEDLFYIEANQVLPRLLESIVKSLLILFSFALSIGD